MTIAHHPGDEALAAFAGGHLDVGQRVVLATHLSLCAHCRTTVRMLECAGGVLLDDEVPVAMQPDAFARALDALGPQDAPSQRIVAARDDSVLAPLAPYALGPWRWRGPGVQWRTVGVPQETDTRVFMLRVAPNTQLPHHTHAGFEWTCVLEGAFRHESGRYGVGDFDDADEDVDHTPMVEPEGYCVCLVAMRGTIQLQGWMRLLQPFVRI